MPVNAEGEEIRPPVSAEIHDKVVDGLRGDVNALLNPLTCLVIRAGGEVLIPRSELDALAHKFTMSEDPATKVVTLRAIRKDGTALALTAAQVMDNARAAAVALPKGGLIIPPTPPKGIILP